MSSSGQNRAENQIQRQALRRLACWQERFGGNATGEADRVHGWDWSGYDR